MKSSYSLRHYSSSKKQATKNEQQDQRHKTLKEVLNRAEKVQSEIVVAEEEAYEGSPNNMATYSTEGEESDNAQERIEMKIDKMLSRLDEVEDSLSTRLNSLTDGVAQEENKMATVEDLSQSTRDQLDGVNIEMEQLKNKVAV